MANDPQYSPRVRLLFDAVPRAGRPPPGGGWVHGDAHDPLTGTRVRFHLRVRDGRIEDARYEVRGCPHTIAAAATVAERLVGQRIDAPQPDLARVAEELGAPPEKLGRLFVIEDAYCRAVLLLRGARA